MVVFNMLVTKPNKKDPKLKSVKILEVFMLSFVPCCLIPSTLKGKKLYPQATG